MIKCLLFITSIISCFTSDYEGTEIMEAMACGCLVLARNVQL